MNALRSFNDHHRPLQREASFRSECAADLYGRINEAQNGGQLDSITKLIYEYWGSGVICDEDASFLEKCIYDRRPVTRTTAPASGFYKPIGRLAGRIGSRFKPRRPQRSPDREKSVERRRMLAASSTMPANIRGRYTEGERAVLCIMAGEVKRQGVCDWPIAKLASIAGVSRTTAQNAFREARRHGHITIQERPVRGRKNLTNLVKITNADWLAWIKRAPAAIRLIGFKALNPTKNIEIKQEQKEECRFAPTAPKPEIEEERKREIDEGGRIEIEPTSTTTSEAQPSKQEEHPVQSAPVTSSYQPDMFGAPVVDLDFHRGKLPPDLRAAARNEYQARGLSLGQFAAEIGISTPQACNVLGGRFGLSPQPAARLMSWLRATA